MLGQIALTVPPEQSTVAQRQVGPALASSAFDYVHMAVEPTAGKWRAEGSKRLGVLHLVDLKQKRTQAIEEPTVGVTVVEVVLPVEDSAQVTGCVSWACGAGGIVVKHGKALLIASQQVPISGQKLAV